MLIERKIFRQIESYINSKEAIIITGMRRTGKTSLVRFIYEKIPSSNKIFLDLENPLNQKYFEETNFEKIKLTLSPLHDEYIRFGGFPEVVLKISFEEKKKSLEDIFTSYFQLEVLRVGDFRKNEVIRDLILLLMERVGSKLDINRISFELGISRITLKEYISFLEETYFIRLVKPFSRNIDTEIRKMPKIYMCDSGLANHFSKINEGSLFENNIFQNLEIRGEVNYYQRKSGVEIDFILNIEFGFFAGTKNFSYKRGG